MARERGAVSVLLAAGALGLCAVALGAADLGALLHARARAQAAADAAALAAVAEQIPALRPGGDPQAAAADAAARNGATLESCACAVGTAAAEVEVSVRPSLAYVTPWFGRTARASARAEADADLLSYRASG